MTKVSVGILGATGMVGMQAVRLLANHPFFNLTFVAASKRSVGNVCSAAPELIIHDVEAVEEAKRRCQLIFSCLDSRSASVWDERYAHAGFVVIANASSHRASPDVPVIIPEINPHHLKVLALQQKRRGWKGALIAKPNCSLQSYMIPLEPLHRLFGVKKVCVTMLQALSGAGFAGLESLDMEDNIVPYIAGEEEKTEGEPLKIWGRVEAEGIAPVSGVTLSAQCTRVPVTDGHLACVSVSFAEQPTLEEIVSAWREFRPTVQQLGLPQAPDPVIRYFEQADRPQVRLDRDAGRGMAVTVGRLRECPVLGVRFVALSHNVIRGAAGGSLLTAELLYNLGIFTHDTKKSDIFAAAGELPLS